MRRTFESVQLAGQTTGLPSAPTLLGGQTPTFTGTGADGVDLPWREANAKIIEIGLKEDGSLDFTDFEEKLNEKANK